MSEKRKVLKEVIACLEDAQLEAHKVEPKKIRKCLEILNDLANSNYDDPVTGAKPVDYRTRKMAAAYLVDHDWAVYEHEHPVEQKHKHEISGGININMFQKKPVGAKVG